MGCIILCTLEFVFNFINSSFHNSTLKWFDVCSIGRSAVSVKPVILFETDFRPKLTPFVTKAAGQHYHYFCLIM